MRFRAPPASFFWAPWARVEGYAVAALATIFESRLYPEEWGGLDKGVMWVLLLGTGEPVRWASLCFSRAWWPASGLSAHGPCEPSWHVCIPSCTEIFSDFAALASPVAAHVYWAAGQGGLQAATSCGGGDRAGSQAGHGGHVVKIAVDVYEFDCALAIEYLESRWREGLRGWPPLPLARRGWK